MKQNLFLAPASKSGSAYSHLKKGVVEGFSKDKFRIDLETSDENVRIWGINPGLENTWNRVEPDDWILFYTGNNEYKFAVQILNKDENPQLGSEIRKKYLDVSNKEQKEGKEWHFLLYFRTPFRIELCAERLSDWLNYERAYRSRFQRVPEERLQKIEKEYETLEDLVSSFIVEKSEN